MEDIWRTPVATLNVKNLPLDLAEKLRERARREHRSVTQQVIHILSVALSVPEPLSILELRGLGKESWEKVKASEHVTTERD